MALSWNQRRTTIGIAGGIVSAILAREYISKDLIAGAAVGYGLGAACSSAFYRVASLLKNGDQDNTMGAGTLAGISLFAGILGITALPNSVSFISQSAGLSTPVSIIIGVAATVAGFLHSRDSYTKDLAEAIQEPQPAARGANN